MDMFGEKVKLEQYYLHQFKEAKNEYFKND